MFFAAKVSEWLFSDLFLKKNKNSCQLFWIVWLCFLLYLYWRYSAFINCHSDKRKDLLHVYTFHSLLRQGLFWATLSASNLACLMTLQVGISVFVTGGIGGVHREGETSKESQSLPLWWCVCFGPITFHKNLLNLPYLKKPAQYIGLNHHLHLDPTIPNHYQKKGWRFPRLLDHTWKFHVIMLSATDSLKRAKTCQLMTSCGHIWQPWTCPRTWQSLAVLQ